VALAFLAGFNLHDWPRLVTFLALAGVALWCGAVSD